jgi:predicted AAA+ superfamily ATPase
MVIKCQNLTEFNTPISGYIRPNSFKLYYFDIGLMTASLDKNITSSIFLNDISKFKGVIYENLFADFFYKNNLSIYFLNEYKSYEIDFLIQTNNILYAIEVKTSNGRSKSLKTFQQTYPNKCKGIKFIAGNCGVNDNYITLPQYLGIFIK